MCLLSGDFGPGLSCWHVILNYSIFRPLFGIDFFKGVLLRKLYKQLN